MTVWSVGPIFRKGLFLKLQSYFFFYFLSLPLQEEATYWALPKFWSDVEREREREGGGGGRERERERERERFGGLQPNGTLLLWYYSISINMQNGISNRRELTGNEELE